MLSEKFIAASTLFVLRVQPPWIIGTVCIALALALFPTLFGAWRNELAKIPSIYHVYEALSSFKGFASIFFSVASIPLFIAALFGKHAYPDWNAKISRRPTLQTVLNNKIYPRNLRGIVAFYSFLAIDLLADLTPFVALCLLAHLIKH